MADINNTINFKNCQIVPDEDLIVEYKKEEILTYKLSDVFKRFEGEGRFVNLTIKEVTELQPSEQE